MGDATSPYGLTKQWCESLSRLHCFLHGQPSIGLRFFTVYGPRGRNDMAPRIFLERILADEYITKLGDGTSFRDFTYVDDVVRGIYLAITSAYRKSQARNREAYSKVYNIGRGKPIRLNEFIEACTAACGRNCCKIHTMDSDKADVRGTYADTTLARNELGYKPVTDIADGLARTVQWMVADKEKESAQVSAPRNEV